MGNKASLCCYKVSRCEESKKSRDSTQNNDRITDLPDVILHHILSLLPVKTIAQTSVLSRRWSYLWASYPVLDFCKVFPMPYIKAVVDEEKLEKQTKAMKFITTVFFHRHENSNINVFRAAGPLSSSCLHDIIGRVVKHRVEELSLEVWLSDTCEVPHCLFECDSLRNLELESRRLDSMTPIRRPHLKLRPAKSGLRSLHTLSLTYVDFLDGPLDAADIFSSSLFPSLEKLTINYCKNMPRDLKVSGPNLKDVQIYEIAISSLDISGMSLENLKVKPRFNKVDKGTTWINIFAPNLQTFDWKSDEIADKCWIESFPILRTSLINFSMGKNAIYSTISLLSALTQVQNLTITYPCLQEWNNLLLDMNNCTEQQYWETRTQFCQLKVVEIYTDDMIPECAINIVRFLLEHGRNLQVVVLILRSWSDDDDPSPALLDHKSIIEGFPRASSDVKICFRTDD